MRVVHMGDLGRKGGWGGRRGWGGGWGPWWYGGAPEPLENKYVILDPNGNAIAVVSGIPKVPKGYSFRVATPAEAALNLPSGVPMAVPLAVPAPVAVPMARFPNSALQGYIVRGPQGEMYGRYANRPTASQIPLYAMVEEEKGMGDDIF